MAATIDNISYTTFLVGSGRGTGTERRGLGRGIQHNEFHVSYGKEKFADWIWLTLSDAHPITSVLVSISVSIALEHFGDAHYRSYRQPLRLE